MELKYFIFLQQILIFYNIQNSKYPSSKLKNNILIQIQF